MKLTYIKYKNKSYLLSDCQVFSDCVRHVEYDLHDDEKTTTIMPNGDWDYIELEVLQSAMTMEEYDKYIEEVEQIKVRKMMERRRKFDELHPELSKLYRGDLWIQYCKDNPI